MALIPTRWVNAYFPPPPGGESEWTEGMGGVGIERGYYVNPAKPDVEILLTSTKSIQNASGSEILRTEEEWTIKRAGAPPTAYTRRTYSASYLPGIGGYSLGTPRLVMEEDTDYWTFTPLAGNNDQNLGKTRRISGYVIYDTPVDTTAPMTSTTAGALAAAQVAPGSFRDRIFHTGRLWSEANHDGKIIPQEGKNQTSIWVENCITEHDLVEDEWDRWIMTTVTKNAIRPQDVKVSDPIEIKKHGIKYSLPVPLDPPELDCIGGHAGAYCEITKGGATLASAFGTFRILPQTYRLYRAVISEPDRTADENLEEWWDDGEAPPARDRDIIIDTAVVNLDGSPGELLPPLSGHVEPHDPEPVEPPADIYFELIATLPNQHKTAAAGLGYAEFLDPDVVNGGEYEYYATACYGEDESEDSNHETIDHAGGESHAMRMAVRTGITTGGEPEPGSTAIDLLAPVDPGLIEDDYGSLLEFQIPTSEDPVVIGTQVGTRQFVKRQAPTAIRFDVMTPLPGLEYAMQVGLPAIEWDAVGNGLRITSETISEQFVLVGFERNIERGHDGTWSTPVTTLVVQEYPR